MGTSPSTGWSSSCVMPGAHRFMKEPTAYRRSTSSAASSARMVAVPLWAFFNEVQTYLKERTGSDDMNVYLKPLGQSLAHLQEASMWFMQNAIAKPDNAGAGSYDYMHLFGLVALGYMWCRIAEAALAKLPKANGSAARLN